MMLSIQILSGERQGMTLELFDLSIPQANQFFLREDEAVKFKTVLDNYYPTLNIVLHEIEVPCSRCYEDNSRWVYEWFPREVYGRKECFFQNYYGIAELQVIAKGVTESNQCNNFDLFIELNPIEVLAKKINADRVEKMLDFLARQDGKDLASAIRVTRIRAGYKLGGRTDNFLLDRIDNNVSFLKGILPAIVLNPLSKLQQITNLVVPNQNTLIDEVSLSWLSENPDNLYQTFTPDEAVLAYGGDYFSSSKVLEAKTITTTDIYENQILHGFVVIMISAAQEIRSKLTASPSGALPSGQTLNGYISLFSQINKFSNIINKNKLEKCSRIINELSRVRATLKRFLPVRSPDLNVPRFTQKAKYNLLYQQIFNRAVIWRRYGAPDWSFQDELFSIQNIPKLFEYYLLCVVKFHIESLSTTNSPVTAVELSCETDIFEYDFEGGHINLMYEPNVWTVNHAHAAGSDLVNTEGWTINQGGSIDRTKISKRGSYGNFSNRSPDIIIDVCRTNGDRYYIILDAKYTDSNRAFLNYLPELTMKYIHGIHRQNSSENPTVALIIVNPDESPSTRHFHHSDYTIYGKYPVTPALMVSSIDVSAAHRPNSNLRNDISQVLNIMGW